MRRRLRRCRSRASDPRARLTRPRRRIPTGRWHPTGCHSATGDLRGIASRITSPIQLQNTWVAGGTGGRGGTTPVTATVTLRSGQKFEGQVIRSDEFIIALALEDGTSRSFRRDGDVPKVEIHNPREGHLKMLSGYSDRDIHDVTAYLVTLK